MGHIPEKEGENDMVWSLIGGPWPQLTRKQCCVQSENCLIASKKKKIPALLSCGPQELDFNLNIKAQVVKKEYTLPYIPQRQWHKTPFTFVPPRYFWPQNAKRLEKKTLLATKKATNEPGEGGVASVKTTECDLRAMDSKQKQ